MSLQLLIDKSTLQALSDNEIYCMSRYYWVVYAPILFVEILGNIKKFEKDKERSLKEVEKVCKKIVSVETTFTCHYKLLLEANLLGYDVEMSGRPVLNPGIVKRDGKGSALIEEEPERAALRRWEEKKIEEAEEVLAERWRLSTKAIDLEGWKKKNRSFPKIKAISELRNAIDLLADNKEIQFECLQLLLRESSVEEEVRKNIFDYWMKSGMLPIKDFAPYAYYCLRVYLGFYLALANGIVGTRSTNRVDLEYFLYLPFCKVFTSFDKFHRTLFPAFKSSGQSFVFGSRFKEDLQAITAYFDALDEKDKNRYQEENGNYPPEIHNSFTLEMWKIHMSPRGSHRPIKRSPEGDKALVERILKKYEELKRNVD